MFYPTMINLKNKNISIVGGGKVAYRKALKLIDYSNNIKVISPKFIDEFKSIGDNIKIIHKEYEEELIKDSFMVIAATNSNEINMDIYRYCNDNNILCSLVDDMDKSDFISTSTIKRGDLVISISTMGKSPSLSSKIRKELEKKYTHEYSDYVYLLGDIRDIILDKCDDINKRKKLLNELIDLDYNELLKRREKYEISSRL